jgi:hypothetical protein
MSDVISSEPTNSHPSSTVAPEPSVEVFAVYGVEPEIQAYAMAKYSRSSLSMKESLKEITSQKAEKFLNTFYFQYGHRSIADLAHIALAIERLSILAAIVVAIRISGRAATTRLVSGIAAPVLTAHLGHSIAKLSNLCFLPTKRFRSGHSNILPALRRVPQK